MGTQTQGGGSDLPPSIQQKIDRIRELQSEIARLTEEAEREYFTAERLERFDEKYRRLSFNDALLLVAFSHPEYSIEFDRCLGYCKKNQLYSFAPQIGEVRLPPVPHDDAHGPAPVINFEECHREAIRIRDAQIAKASEDRKARGEAGPEESSFADRLNEIAAETADFEQRAENARKITTDLSDRGSRNESRDHAPVVEATRDEILTRLAEENAELEARRIEAERIRDSKLSEAELARQKLEPPARP